MSTNQDRPVVGKCTNEISALNAQTSNISFNDVTYSSLKLIDTSDYSYFIVQPSTSPSTHSIEFIYKSGSLSSGQQNFMWLGNGDICVHWKVDENLRFGLNGSSSYRIHDLVNYTGTNFGMNWFVNSTIPYTSSMHVAWISDEVQNKNFVYLNGTLVLSFWPYYNLLTKGVRFTNEVGGSFELTQLAIWEGNQSTDNNTKYPVRTIPYK